MVSLLLGLLLFLGIHSISIAAPAYRDRLVQKSEVGYKAIYSLLSFLGIYLIGVGYAALRAEPVVLYGGMQSLRALVSVLMVAAFILFFAPYFPGKIKAVTRNPQLLSVCIWALAHLLVNGMLADVLLFGAFLLWAVVDMWSMTKREQRTVSPLKPSIRNDIIVLVVGLVVSALFAMFLHGPLIGMPLA
jgi:uncharacterized membrane protein